MCLLLQVHPVKQDAGRNPDSILLVRWLNRFHRYAHHSEGNPIYLRVLNCIRVTLTEWQQ